MQKGNTLVILLVIIGILLIGGGIAFFMTQQKSSPTQTQEMTTEDHSNMMMDDTSPSPATSGGTMTDSDADVTVNITGKNFKFDPEEIRVKKGDTVKVILTAGDMMHDFVIDELNVQSDQIQAGKTTEVTFTADQAGEFEYYCSVGNHKQMGMVGMLIVE